MAEACIGLALMAFTWILLSYSLFMGDNYIRTAMASRYAAWYQGASGVAPTTNQIDSLFFYQPGFITITAPSPTPASILSINVMPLSDGTSANGPFKTTVTFGVADPKNPQNPFPFDLLQTQVPFMTNSMMALGSVSSTCQWDGVGDQWRSADQAYHVVIGAIESAVGGLGHFLGL